MKKYILKLNRNHNLYKFSAFVLIPILASLFIGCEGNDSSAGHVDYNKSYNWVSLPSVEKSVDVFYVYPTVSANESGVMDINNPSERDLAIAILKSQASVFETHANIFAPYYRQMTLRFLV